nr:MAG TPA: hypothetical protein [Caudoviricetes sp.]
MEDSNKRHLEFLIVRGQYRQSSSEWAKISLTKVLGISMR